MHEQPVIGTPYVRAMRPMLLGQSRNWQLQAEARTAAAGGGGIGVADHELRALKVFLLVDFGACQILVTHGVDQERHAILVHGRVIIIGDFVERETVLEA